MRGRGSGKRLVSLFLGCALIVVGLIGPQVVGRADNENINGNFTPSVVTLGAIHSSTFSGTVGNVTPASIASIAARALKDNNGNVITAPASISYVSSSGVVSFQVSTGVGTPAGTYKVSGDALTATLSDGNSVNLAVSATLTVENKSPITPTISSMSVDPSTITRGADAKVTYKGTINNISETYTNKTAKYSNGTYTITSQIGSIASGTQFSTEISIPSTVTEGAYKLTTIEGITGLIIPDSTPTFTVSQEAPGTPTLVVESSEALSPDTTIITRGDSAEGTFIGKVNNLPLGVTTTAAIFSNGDKKIEVEINPVNNNERFEKTFNVPSTTEIGKYYLTTMPGITGLVIPLTKYGFTVKDALDPYVSDVTIANETESGKEVIFTANLKNVPTSTDIGGYFTFKNKSDSTDIVTAGFSATNKSTTDSALLVTNIRTAFSNTSGSDKIYFVSDVTGTKNLNNLTLGTGAHKEIKVKSSSTPTNPTLTDINITSEVLPNGIVYFSGKVSPKPTGDTISASFVPEAIGGTEIPFSTGISSDGTFSGQIPVGNVAVGSIYKLSGVKVGTSYITWDGQYMFRVVSSVSTPTLSTLAIGNPYTTSGTTTIPLSATITSAGTTGGVANTIKYIEIDYAIDTTTPAKATLYSSSSNLFTGNVARQFTNGSSHTITLSRARIYYQAGSDTSGNKVKEYDSLTGLIANNPVRFTVNNYNPSPVNPVNPVNPSNPSTPTGSTAVNQRAANTIIAMANNGSATLDYTSSPTVSANIFDLLRGTQKTVNLLAPGGFIWTFNGATVTGASKQIDLRVTATTLAATGASNSFPLVASLAGNRPVVILNFANNGVLPGTATITIPMSQHTSYIGTSNIYQYFVNESTRRLEKIGGPVTVSSGNTVTMAINHDSTYILTYGEVAGATAPTTPTNNASDVLPIYNANATPTINTPTNTTPTGGTTINTVYRPGSTSPKTGDAFRMYVWVGMLLIGAFLVFASVLWPKKKEKSA